MARSRTVVVTGGASGIGEAVAGRFAVQTNDSSSIDSAVEALTHSVDVLWNVAGVSGASPVPLVLGVNFVGLRHLADRIVPRMGDGGAVVSVASTVGWYWRDHLDEVK